MTLFDSLSDLLTGRTTEEVVPELIVAAARALVLEAEDMDKLSTMLIKFCRLVENEAADMMESKQKELIGG